MLCYTVALQEQALGPAVCRRTLLRLDHKAALEGQLKLFSCERESETLHSCLLKTFRLVFFTRIALHLSTGPTNEEDHCLNSDSR